MPAPRQQIHAHLNVGAAIITSAPHAPHRPRPPAIRRHRLLHNLDVFPGGRRQRLAGRLEHELAVLPADVEVVLCVDDVEAETTVIG